MKLSVRLIHQDNEIIANCPELDINCYGANRDEAVRRIKKVIRFYIDAAKDLGLKVDKLNELHVDDEEEDTESFMTGEADLQIH